jgi:hypothetical protein
MRKSGEKIVIVGIVIFLVIFLIIDLNEEKVNNLDNSEEENLKLMICNHNCELAMNGFESSGSRDLEELGKREFCKGGCHEMFPGICPAIREC